MLKRCYEVIDRTTELTRLFESRIGVLYVGDIRPVMTPYARTSRVYRTLYSHLATWYELGAPSFGANLLPNKTQITLQDLRAVFSISSP